MHTNFPFLLALTINFDKSFNYDIHVDTQLSTIMGLYAGMRTESYWKMIMSSLVIMQFSNKGTCKVSVLRISGCFLKKTDAQACPQGRSTRHGTGKGRGNEI